MSAGSASSGGSKRWKVAAPTAAAALALGAGGYWWWTDGTDEGAVQEQQAVQAQVELDCGGFDFPSCDGEDAQFDPAFTAEVAAVPEEGGFGGGECTPQRTPVVFIHGNADRAINWDSEITGPVEGYPAAPASVYDTFLDAGYQPCELYGMTFLDDAERGNPAGNFHKPAKYQQIVEFVDDVKEVTGSDEVDVVTHSLGVSMSLAAFTWHDETRPDEPKSWDSVRRFVNIAGGLHGLGSCRAAGPANPLAKTCGSQNIYDKWVFGFYPDAAMANNDWTGSDSPNSLRQMPAQHPDVAFYTITAGDNDQVHCGALAGSSCTAGALFSDADNVRAQLDVGTGARAGDIDYDTDDGAVFTIAAGDVNGVGHFKAKNNTGQILVEMLGSECTGADCQGDYAAGPVELAS